MADISLVTADQFRLASLPQEQHTLIASVDIDAGEVVRIIQSSTGAGKWAKADGTDYEKANAYGVAIESVLAGSPLTAVRRGLVDGYDLSNLNYNVNLYLSDTAGALADAPGTIEKRIGFVVPVTTNSTGADFDKVLMVDVPQREEAYVSADFGGTTDEKVAALVAALVQKGIIATATY